MRYLFTFLLLLAITGLSAQTPVITLSQPVYVAGTAQYGSVKPRVALTTGNVPVVMWSKTGPGRIFVSRWNGSGFTTPLQVTPSGVDLTATAGEGPSVAASGDTVFVAFSSLPYDSSIIYVVRSVDGGITFGDTVRADHQTTAMPPYTPYVAISNGGNPFLTYEISTPSMAMPEQLFCRSTDGGATFTTEVSASAMGPGVPCECCPPSLVVKDSLVFLMYRNNVNNIRNIYVAVSQDYGATFNNVVQIDNTNWNTSSCPTTGPEGIISGDSLIVTWKSRQGGQQRVFYNKMDISTLQTGFTQRIDPAYSGTGTQRYPAIAGANDTIAIVWDDNRAGNYNCYISVSVNNGITFSPPMIINDTNSLAGTQQTPHIIYKDGTFHIVYQNTQTNEVIYRSAQITGTLGTSVVDKAQVTLTAAPNPFSSTTTLHFTNEKNQAAVIEIIDAAGRIVRRYENIRGTSLMIDKKDLAPGIYLATVSAGETKGTITLMIAK